MKNGFSLIEVLIAILLVGLAIASLVAANIAFTDANGAGADLSTAEFLGEQIRELTTLLPYDDLDDFVGANDTRIFSPPIGSNSVPLPAFAAFRQQITVENVSSSNFEQVVGHHNSPFVRLTVKVSLNGRELSSASWIRARY